MSGPSKEWCMKMAALEEGCSVEVGLRSVHVSRTPEGDIRIEVNHAGSHPMLHVTDDEARDLCDMLTCVLNTRLKKCDSCARYFTTTKGTRRWCSKRCDQRERKRRQRAGRKEVVRAT